MHWTERIEAIGELYLRNTFGLNPDQPIPPVSRNKTHWRISNRSPKYITIHQRHGDFSNWCNGNPLEECFAPITVIARRVREIQEELSIKYPGMNPRHVIMTSDERDEDWWDLVKAQGWYRIDHSNTVANYDRWFALSFLFLSLSILILCSSGTPSSSMPLSSPTAWASLVMIVLPSPPSLVVEWRTGMGA